MICFDLEGPLSPQDNAYEVMKLIKNGDKIFEVISRYDDILTIEGRKGYEPGDTLKLIVPFLLYHDITEEDIKNVSNKAKLVKGAKKTISYLKRKYEVCIISTSYEQHALNIAKKLNVERENVACTKLRLDYYRDLYKNKDLSFIEKVEKRILEMYPNVDVKYLDNFFFVEVKEHLKEIFEEVTVVGGSRKVDAMKNFAEKKGVRIDRIAVIGDSITDYKMLDEIKDKGLAIAFNANEYALPYATVGLASIDLRYIVPLIEGFEESRQTSIKLAESFENAEINEIVNKLPKEVINSDIETKYRPYYNVLLDIDIKSRKFNEILNIHKKYRMIVRGEAGKLG